MTRTLLVFLPMALLVLVSACGFVGCVLNTHGLGPAFTTYKPSASTSSTAMVRTPDEV